MLVRLHREPADPRPAMIIPDLLAETRRSPELALDALGGVPFWWATVHRAPVLDDESLRRLSAFVVRALR